MKGNIKGMTTKGIDIKVLVKLVGNDLKARYSGSAFGIVWAYIQPLVTILVFWYVFQIGFRNPPIANVEYILWFVAGFIPWTYFNDGVLSSTNVFYEYSYLVKKMKFQVWQLPIIKVLSSFCIHVFFMIFILGIYIAYGHRPQISWVSMVYYSFGITVLLTGISYVVSSLAVFFKDWGQLVNVIMQILFWLTPIFWDISSMTPQAVARMKYNPLYYVIVGYRDALINNIGFWQQNIWLTAYFWCTCVMIMMAGVIIYQKLKHHFSDLL